MTALFSHSDVMRYVPLKGSERELVPGSRPAGPADPNEAITVTVHVRSSAPNEALDTAFETLAQQPLEARNYLTHDELNARFGATASDLDAVEEFAHQFNLNVLDRDPNKQSVILGGTVDDFSNAFKVNLHHYHNAGGNYRGRTGPVYIPQPLEGIVTGVFGLDNRPKRRARRQRHPLLFDATMPTHAVSSPVPAGLFSAADLATRYQFPTAANGTGQTVAIIELGGGYLQSDLVAYFQRIGIPTPSVVSVSVDHGRNRPTPGQDSPDGEVMLDIEVVGAAAPGAKQVIYFGPNQGNGFFDAISAAVMDNQRKPSVISISWGGPEEGETPQTLAAQDALFKKAALLGITICVASGDHGSADIDPEDPAFDGRLHVDSPACLAGSLACGGTSITAASEVAWKEENGWAGGGGVSTVVARPSYQNQAGVPVSPVNGFAGRGIPDVSGSATNYFVRVRGQFGPSGGTSAVAPLWAGLVARLNQAKGKRVGFLNPILYAHPNVCTDIVTGNNDILGSNPPHYAAKKGWDAATGLGVPNGMELLGVL